MAHGLLRQQGARMVALLAANSPLELSSTSHNPRRTPTLAGSPSRSFT
jgi:hypothetical protein